MIKLIVSDLDGTLVEDGGGVLNPEYFSQIRRLKKAGILFAAVSGRSYSSLEKLFAPVIDDIPISFGEDILARETSSPVSEKYSFGDFTARLVGFFDQDGSSLTIYAFSRSEIQLLIVTELTPTSLEMELQFISCPALPARTSRKTSKSLISEKL